MTDYEKAKKARQLLGPHWRRRIRHLMWTLEQLEPLLKDVTPEPFFLQLTDLWRGLRTINEASERNWRTNPDWASAHQKDQ